MDTNKTFPRQEAPVKNTDDAFVQVSEDGSPALPATDADTTETETDEAANAAGNP